MIVSARLFSVVLKDKGMNGKANMLALTSAALVLAVCGVADATTVSWDGVTWDSAFGSIAVVPGPGADMLVVTTQAYSSDGWCFGAAHYNTPDAFRASNTPWVQFTYYDSSASTLRSGAEVWMEREDGAVPTPVVGAAWTQWGTSGDDPQYGVYWWNEHTDTDGSATNLGLRTPGFHTLKMGMRATGQVDYWLDGSLLFTTTSITPDYFGDIYLAADSDLAHPGQTVVFTDYRSGTDYAGPPVPEPITMFSALLAIGSLGAYIRKRAKTSAAG